MSIETSDIVLSLISHTNIGKTTLSRTLLKQDVGEIRDSAHVTIDSQSYDLIRSGNDALIIWDTPGFGNIVKLTKRVKSEGALGWIMHEVVDRTFNRSLYSSLEAAKNVQSQSDVVLYLVNVQEKPDEAGYVEQELTLLEALKKPTIVLLNKVSTDELGRENLASLEKKWYDYAHQYECVKNVITLDAFTRTWEQELQLIDEIHPYLSEIKQGALQRLRSIFIEDQEKVFKQSMQMGADVVSFAISQKVPYNADMKEKKVMALLMGDLQPKLDEYLEYLTSVHKIESAGQGELKNDRLSIAGFIEKVSEKKSGLLAGALASAGSGLIADILAGGLTLGGGALLGFIGGYVGGISYAKILNFRDQQDPTWEKSAIEQIIKLVITYYLITALHGRGKGRLHLKEPAKFISDAIDAIWDDYKDDAHKCMEVVLNGADKGEFNNLFLELFTHVSKNVRESIFGKGTVSTL